MSNLKKLVMRSEPSNKTKVSRVSQEKKKKNKHQESAILGEEKAEDINKIRHLLKDSDNVTFKLSCKDYYGEVEYL